jgi:hypothetical protein
MALVHCEGRAPIALSPLKGPASKLHSMEDSLQHTHFGGQIDP